MFPPTHTLVWKTNELTKTEIYEELDIFIGKISQEWQIEDM